LTSAASTSPSKIERVHGTLIQTLLCGLPCYTGGPRGADGSLEDPRAP
jgi:hypothetical protein